MATYSQTGAQFGYSQLWTALYMLPFMIAVQEACARIGLVTGKGIAAVVKQHYSRFVLYSVVILVLLANTINIGADIGAMAASAKLLVNLPFAVLILFFAAGILILEIFTSYRMYARILKWLALVLLAYPITALMVHEPWLEILKATLVPHLDFNFGFLFIIIGVFGTTISPYMFFWQASQEVEESRLKGYFRKNRVRVSSTDIKSLRIDNATGMILSEITTWSIIVVGATVLHSHGVTDIKSAAGAAKALQPLVHSFPHAGYLSKLIFSLGIIGLGLLAVPVLSSSAAYAISESVDWKASLNLKLNQAHGFYGVITISTLIGLMINFIGINPVKALVYSAVLNGLAAVPLLFLIAHIGANKKIMGARKSSLLSSFLVWSTFAFMGIAAIGMVLLIKKF
ncbi:MAG TPA: divalent metal cation transporter [Chitinophagaceae bacterium]|nr:divalent metal cation transporter [Chitinophagaceae bacterium]